MNSAGETKDRSVLWMRRLTNFAFVLASLYTAYLIFNMLSAANKNSKFEGQPIGAIEIEAVGFDGTSEAILSSKKLWSDTEPSARRSKKAIILWATWCGPCHSLLMDLKEEVASGKLDSEKLLAVSVGEPLSDVSTYLKLHDLPFTVALDREYRVAKRFSLQGTPTVILVDDLGIVTSVSTGGFRLASKISSFLK